jgi:hypoxia up-regulated 1
MVKESIEKAAAAKSKSAEEASKASASPSSSSTGSSDALDDLDDDASTTASSSSSATPPMPSIAADAEIYSESDLKFLQETMDKTNQWLEEKEAAQQKLSETDDPALTIKDLNEQKKKVDDAVMEMMTKKFKFINKQQAEQRKEQERIAKEKARAKKAAKKEKAAKKNKDKKAEKEGEKTEAEAEQQKKDKNSEGPSEEELREALKKAGLSSEDGVKLENLGPKDDLKDKDGNPLLKLNLGKDASEEEILAAIDKIVGEGREKKVQEEEAKKKEGHDEL